MTIKQILQKIKHIDSKILKLSNSLKEAKKESISLAKQSKAIHTKANTPETYSPLIPTDWKQKGLNPNQCKFVVEYLTNGHNATQAYLKVHPKVNTNTAGVEGYNSLRNPKIREVIKDYLTESLNTDKLTLEHDIIQTYKAQSFYNPQLFINLDGSPKYKTWDKIPKELHCIIEGIEVKTFGQGKYREDKVVIKLADRSKALLQLGKYVELIKNDTNPLELKMTEETATQLAKVFRGKK